MRTHVLLALVVTGVVFASSVHDAPLHAQSPRSIWSGIYTEPQARRGEELYAKRCSQCHGADLAGIPLEPQQRFVNGPDRTPPLVGPIFLANYDDLPLCELVERIRISMPQDKPGSLTRRDVVDVVAYLFFQGGFPFGRAELTARFDELQEIRVLAQKPSGSAPVVQRPCQLPAWK